MSLCLYSTKIKCTYFLLIECCVSLFLFSCCHHSYVQAQLCHSHCLLVLLFWYCAHFHSQIYITKEKTADLQGAAVLNLFLSETRQVIRKILVY